MARDWVELHTTSDPDILLGISEFTNQNDSLVPEANPNSIVRFIETTGRLDGPFGTGRQYIISTDTFEDFIPPPEPPPTLEETELEDLIAKDATDHADMQILLNLAIPSWTQADRDSAAKMSLRKLEITRLQTIVAKQ